MTEEAYKTCTKCGITSNNATFSYARVSYCDSCNKKYQSILNRLKKENPYPVNHFCDICGKSEDELPANFGGVKSTRRTPWRLDHCHETNTFRGFLCSNCNTGLGLFKDDPAILQNAIDYLLAHKEKTAMQDIA